MLRLAAIFAIASSCLAFGAEQSRADWCGVESKGITNCGYASVEQCRIGLNGVGNCFQQTPAAPAVDRRARAGRTAR